MFFFRNFLGRVEYERNSGVIFFFFSLFRLSYPVLAKNNAGKTFFDFFLFFSEFSCPGQVWTEFGTKFFFFVFLGLSHPFWIKIMPERGIFIFWIFMQFFSEFSCPGWVWTEFRTKIFFFVFFSLSHLVLAKNNAGKRFFNFLIFFLFFRNFHARVEYEGNSGLKVFSRFLSICFG